MIRLSRGKDSRSLDLGFGVSVVVKPLTFALWRAASLAAERRAIQVATEKGLVEAAGGVISDIPDPSDRDGIAACSTSSCCRGLKPNSVRSKPRSVSGLGFPGFGAATTPLPLAAISARCRHRGEFP